MRRVTEYTNLAKARVFYDGKGSYTFNFDKGYKLPNPYVFRGDHDSFVRFLMGIKAKDNKTWPRSVRGERYSDIADEIESGSDQIIYVWEHDFMRYLNHKKVKEEVIKNPSTVYDIIDVLDRSLNRYADVAGEGEIAYYASSASSIAVTEDGVKFFQGGKSLSNSLLITVPVEQIVSLSVYSTDVVAVLKNGIEISLGMR